MKTANDETAWRAPRAPPGERYLYEFGPFLLRASDRSLFRAGQRVRVTPRVLDLLLCLVEEAGRVVTKESLLERVWDGTFVEEGNVNRTISTLRRLLEESETCLLIETIPRRGYRFVAAVARRVEPESAVEEPTVERLTAVTRAAEEPSEAPRAPSPEPPDRPPLATSSRASGLSWRSSRKGRWAAVAFLALPVFVTSVAASLWRDRAGSSPQRIAVLPFRFTAGAANGETLGLALADGVITRLSRADHLVIRPTSAVLRFADGRADPLEAARRLDVDAVLDGKVTQERSGTQVSWKLVRRRDGVTVLSERFQTGATGLLQLQDRVSERIVATLLVTLAPEAGRSDARRLAATELYVRGRQLWSERPSGSELPDEAAGLFRRAIEADPEFALAHVGLADALVAAWLDAASLDAAPAASAERAARRALAIDDRLGPAHATLGCIRMLRDWDWPEAEKELSRALELEPSNPHARRWGGTLLALTARPTEAKDELARAVELDPTSPAVLCDAGRLALWRGELGEARAFLSRARASVPTSSLLAALEGGIHEAEDPASARVRALAMLSSLGLGPRAPVGPRPERDELSVSRALALAGRADPALAWLAEAIRQRRLAAPFAAVDPAFRALRKDPRFAALLRSMALPSSRA